MTIVAPPFKNLFSLIGKTVVVTGGSGGLGLTVSKYLLQAGASLALIDNNLPKLEPATEQLTKWYQNSEHKNESAGEQKISSWACDISDPAQVKSTVSAIRDHHAKPLDVLVNAAGYCENFSALEYPPLNYKRLIDVNVNGSFFMATEVARTQIADQIKGSIILVASMSGSIANPTAQSAYNASKSANLQQARSLAAEWSPYNIRVNSLSPGYIETPLTKTILDNHPGLKKEWESRIPMSRMADPSEFAGPIIFMASDAGSYFTGQDLLVDGGYTVW